MEFGMDEQGNIILIDELLTPDSSRFWPRDRYKPGEGQPSFDKQFVRDYLLSINFNKKPPGPKLPEEIILKTSALYLEALKILTGQSLV
jgi:phosphoribosylaminoimidazole-succinocarboxamide synthase